MYLIFTVRTSFVRTTKDYGYNFFWLAGYTSHHVVFRLKAGSDCHIAISQTAGDTSAAYEIVIGGWYNAISAIREAVMQDVKAQADTPGILSPNEWRTFWIRWTGGHVEVGKGHDVGNNRFMDWQQTGNIFNITAIGVSTGFGNVGDYEFSTISGDIISYKEQI